MFDPIQKERRNAALSSARPRNNKDARSWRVNCKRFGSGVASLLFSRSQLNETVEVIYKLFGPFENIIISASPYILPALSPILIQHSLSLGGIIVGINHDVFPS